jgi:hypothetical protein
MLNAKGNPVAIRDYSVQPDIIDMERLEDFNDPYDWILSGQSPKVPLAKEFELNPPYDALIIDQVTEVQQMYFDRVLGTDRILKPAAVVGKREWEHYNKVLYSMMNFIRLYYSLPMHVIMVAHEREGDSAEGRPIGPYLEGQGQAYLCGTAELIARMVARKNVSRGLQKAIGQEEGADVDYDCVAFFESPGNFYAKDQVSESRLGSYMLDPTLPRILSLINPE